MTTNLKKNKQTPGMTDGEELRGQVAHLFAVELNWAC